MIQTQDIARQKFLVSPQLVCRSSSKITYRSNCLPATGDERTDEDNLTLSHALLVLEIVLQCPNLSHISFKAHVIPRPMSSKTLSYFTLGSLASVATEPVDFIILTKLPSLLVRMKR